jgi:hypothetical protein
VEVRSEVPIAEAVTLTVAAVETTVLVREEETLINPESVSATQFAGPDQLRSRASSAPGRSVVDMVNSQPGWLLEANGVLHPRGSEYNVQYVINGIPLYDNRSPAFAQSLGIDEFESMTMRTSGFPAEFGRSLGAWSKSRPAMILSPACMGSSACRAAASIKSPDSLRCSMGAARTRSGSAAKDF